MILTGKEIKRQHDLGKILITPWDDSRLNPNSYNLSLGNDILEVHPSQDMKLPTITGNMELIPEEGLWLQPGRLYLARTSEYTETHGFVPMLEGRSSIGRLGMFIHVTAGFGDVGFCGYWTLELVVVHPLKVYPKVEIAQVYYHEVSGEITTYFSGKYQKNSGIQTSGLWTELTNSKKLLV